MRIQTGRASVTARGVAMAAVACLVLVACGDGGDQADDAPATPTATVPDDDTEETSPPDDETAAGPPAGGPADVMAADAAADIQGESIKIGLITVTEGSPFASNGQRTLEGAQYAVEEINAAGGIDGVPIELIVEDTKGSIEGVANIVRKLASQDEVLAIVGPILSGECEVGCPLANDLGVPVVAPGVGKPGVVEAAGEYVFKLVADDNVHSHESLLPVLEERGTETAVIIKDELDPTSAFMGDVFWPSLFEDAGVEVVKTLTFTSGDTDFSAQVTEIASAGADVVALAAGPADAARIAIEMQRQGVDAQLLGSGGLQSAGQDFLEAGGDAIEGAILAAQFNPDPDDSAQAALIESFEESTGSDVTLNAAYAYDAVYIVAAMIKRQGVTNDPSQLEEDRERIKDGLPELSDWIGMGGPTSLNPDGTVRRQPQIATVEDGELVISVTG